MAKLKIPDGMVFKRLKVKVHLTKEQHQFALRIAGACRFIYNWSLANFRNSDLKKYSSNDEAKKLTLLKKEPGFEWLNELPRFSICKAFDDLAERIFKYGRYKTNYRSKKKTAPSFGLSNDRISKAFKVSSNKVWVHGFPGVIKLGQKNYIPVNLKNYHETKTHQIRGEFDTSIQYFDPRLKYDGVNWWLTVGVLAETQRQNAIKNPQTDPIGIDLGKCILAQLSNGIQFNYDKKQIRKLEQRIKRISNILAQRHGERSKNDPRPIYDWNSLKTKKLLQQLHKDYRKITNLKTDIAWKIADYVVKLNPKQIGMESLYLKGLLKKTSWSHKDLTWAALGRIKRIVQWKCDLNGIYMPNISRWYPSTLTCSNCGYKKPKKDKALERDRIYICPECGHIEDRDLNAAKNLARYGLK